MTYFRGILRLVGLASVTVAIWFGAVLPAQSSWATGVPSAKPQIESYAKLVYWTYKDCLSRVRALEKSIQALLETPDEPSLKRARESWLTARAAYGQSEAFRFYGGPIDYYDPARDVEGPEGRLNSWPLNEAYIDYVHGNPSAGIINDESIELTRISILSSNQTDDDRDVSTGYHAIEFLLWGQDLNEVGPGTRPVSDFESGINVNDRRRQYLELVTAQLVEDHEFLVAEWRPATDNYAAAFRAMPEDKTLAYILTGILIMSQFELASERIAVPLDSGDPEDEHSCFSDNTHNDFLYNALGIENVYFGRYGDYYGVGISDLVEKINPNLNQRMIEVLARTISLVKRIGSPFDLVLASPHGSLARENAELAVDALMTQAALIREVGAQLDLTVNVHDGEVRRE
ncbi:MAG: imelysin family protein [Alphaproteobacteria bacterium]